MSEKYYDEVLAPQLGKLAEDCAAHGMSFVAVVDLPLIYTMIYIVAGKSSSVTMSKRLAGGHPQSACGCLRVHGRRCRPSVLLL
jgi:hypothetical protein